MTDDRTAEPEIIEQVEEIEPLEPISDPVGTARRKHGAAGAVLAAGLFGVDIALGRKPKEEIPVVVDSAGEPTDIDKDGIRIPVDEHTTVVAPALPPSDPLAPKPRRRKG
ncbi:MAG: hypothetical protein RL238_842 [Actinomycetota bacterium]